MDLVTKVPRGRTFYGTETIPTAGESVDAEGVEHMFDDVAAGQTTQVKVKRSNRKVHAILVRNDSAATTFAAGDVVVWKAGYRGRRIGAKSGTAGEEIAGVVDDHLPTSGCRVGDFCWIIRKGPVLAKKATGDDLAEGEAVKCDNGGKIVTTGTPADATAAALLAINTVGRVQTAAATNDTTVLVDLNL